MSKEFERKLQVLRKKSPFHQILSPYYDMETSFIMKQVTGKAEDAKKWMIIQAHYRWAVFQRISGYCGGESNSVFVTCVNLKTGQTISFRVNECYDEFPLKVQLINMKRVIDWAGYVFEDLDLYTPGERYDRGPSGITGILEEYHYRSGKLIGRITEEGGFEHV